MKATKENLTEILAEVKEQIKFAEKFITEKNVTPSTETLPLWSCFRRIQKRAETAMCLLTTIKKLL